MNKEIWFIYWLIVVILSIGVQILGNSILEIKNVGIVIAILLAVTLWMDGKDVK